MIARVLFILLLAFPVAFAQDSQSERSVSDLIQDGNIYLGRGDCTFAQYVFQEALKQDSSNVEATLGKGEALVCQGATSRGIEEFQNVINMDRNNVDARVQLSLAYRDQYFSDSARFPNGLTDALTTLQEAENIDPNNAEVFNAKGVILFQTGDVEGAKTALERAVSLATNSGMNERDLAQMNVNLGKSYRDLNQLELALQSFKRAVALNPLSAVARTDLGDTYFRLGECDQAIFELSQASALNPQLLDAVANLAISLFECDDVQASIPKFEQALEIPGSLNIPPLYTYLSRAYVQEGRFDDAVRRAQQGALLPPLSADAFYYLGQAYESRGNDGDLESAKTAYNRALEINPNHEETKEALSRIP